MACAELRDNLRTNITECRQASRSKTLQSKRKTLEDINVSRLITNSEVSIIGNKLKLKSGAQVKDLELLKLAFVQGSENIIAFLKVKGALQALVRELSSKKSNYQLVAAECCCNLALGDSKTCLLVAKAAGPYLIANLSGLNYNLINACVWALGNLAGSGDKTWLVLHSQGFLGKLLKLIQDINVQSDTQVKADILENSLTALVHILRIALLTPEEVKTIAETVLNLEGSSAKSAAVVLFLLSCIDSAEQELLNYKVHQKCLQFMSETELTDETVASYTTALRTLANLIADVSGTCVQEVVANWDAFKDIIQKTFSSPFPHLTNEVGWLIGNIMNHPSKEVQDFVNKLSFEFEIFATQMSFLPTC